ncbi:MAG: hypothetical protein JO032_06855 [Alphaproteobacteria bacterium]|nr:hypothetical protein [Alphaproteobacteria bacterium]MBV9552495.1 hypothetical protein [Alphaproteobacteria bacterium]
MTVALLLLGAALPANSQGVVKTNTVDAAAGVYARHALAGLIVMGKPCNFGESYHYQLTSGGELRVEGAITCPGGGITAKEVNGNDFICRLDAKLTCSARPAAAAAMIAFKVDENGVTAGSDPAVAWTEPQQAVAVLSGLRLHPPNAKSDDGKN